MHSYKLLSRDRDSLANRNVGAKQIVLLLERPKQPKRIVDDLKLSHATMKAKIQLELDYMFNVHGSFKPGYTEQIYQNAIDRILKARIEALGQG